MIAARASSVWASCVILLHVPTSSHIRTPLCEAGTWRTPDRHSSLHQRIISIRVSSISHITVRNHRQQQLEPRYENANIKDR
eukprot:2563777-Rhodomonas_salina.1